MLSFCSSNKRGVVDCSFKGCKLDGNNVNWFYNYQPNNFRNIPSSVSEFIPMIKNRTYLNSLNLNGAIFTSRPKYILSVNEPDMVKGLNQMTMEEALSIHKEIEDKINPEQLGSPAITKRYGLPWLKTFVNGTDDYKPRIDFICIHWYDYDAIKFIEYVDLIYKTFNKPIWITEFSIVDWKMIKPINHDIVKQFMDIALPALESRDYVIRYAWFSSNKRDFPQLANASLWDEATKDLTDNGKYYFNKN